MPKESVIRKKVIDKLEKDGWICWYPYKAKYAKEVDIFGVFDVIAIHSASNDPPYYGAINLIQLTDYTNVSKRVKKVTAWLDTNQIRTEVFNGVVSMEVWGWNPKKKEFRIVTL